MEINCARHIPFYIGDAYKKKNKNSAFKQPYNKKCQTFNKKTYFFLLDIQNNAYLCSVETENFKQKKKNMIQNINLLSIIILLGHSGGR